GLTGGYLPLAATLATEEIFKGFYADYAELKTFFHGHTYTGNPLACAAAIANLEIFEKECTLTQLEQTMEQLKILLDPFAHHPHVKEVRRLGMMVGIELIQDKKRADAYPPQTRMGHRVTLAARRRGLIIRPLGNVVVLMPPLSISLNELKSLILMTLES